MEVDQTMSSHQVTVTGYALVLLGCLVLELLGRLGVSSIPSFGRVLDHAMASRAGRLGILAAWVWIGLHFFAR